MARVIRRCPIRGFLLLLFSFSEMVSCFLLSICHKMQWLSSHLCPLLPPSPLLHHLIPHTDCRGKLPSCGCPGFYSAQRPHTSPPPDPCPPPSSATTAELGRSKHLQYDLALCSPTISPCLYLHCAHFIILLLPPHFRKLQGSFQITSSIFSLFLSGPC